MKRLHLWVDLVGQGLEEDGGGRDLFAIGCVVSMGKMPTTGQVKAHDPVMRVEQRCVDCKVCRAAQHHNVRAGEGRAEN